MRIAAGILTIIFATFSFEAFPNMLINRQLTRMKVFNTQTDVTGWNAVLKGVVIGFSSREDLDENELSVVKQDKSKTTVRLYSREGIREGSTLYVINDKNLIVGKMMVKQLFKSASFGYMLIGHGSFILCNYGDRVVQRVFDEYARYAYIHKARGDFYLSTGEKGKAIAEYKKSIELDRGYPEAHFSLGNIYLKQNMLQFAFKEYREAYSERGRLYDNEDRFLLLKNMTSIRFREVFYSYLPFKTKNSYRSEGIKYAGEALAIYPDSVEINYILGMFYHKNPENLDVNAKNHFLRVIKIRPYHTGANIGLAELYFKHRNKAKAKIYARAALKSDPNNRRARQLLKYIEKYK